MQIFFWFSIILLASACFFYINAPILSAAKRNNAENLVKKPSLTILFASVLTLGSVGLYIIVGTPNALKAPQTPVIDQKYAAIIEQVEAHLAENPEDAEGWQVLAPTYFSLNQPEKAFDAFANAIKFGNSNGQNWLGLGKSNLILNKGVFGPMTKVAFGKAIEKMPDDIEAMYFYAAMLQDDQQLIEAQTAINDFIKLYKYSAEQLKPLNEILQSISRAETN